MAITQYFAVVRNIGRSSQYLELIHADIIFNTRDHQFSTDENEFTMYDMPSIALHELGHLLGLGHTSFTDDSVMIPYIDTETTFRTLTELDIQNIEENYSTSLTDPIRVDSTLNAINKPDEWINGIIEIRDDGSHHHYRSRTVGE